MSIVDVLRSKFSDIPHTATPWVMEEQWTGLVLKPAEGNRHTIVKIHGTRGQDLADALFVYDAANAHDELVAALKSFSTLGPDGSRCFCFQSEFAAWAPRGATHMPSCNQANAVLARARGEAS